jgi:hypothetical protein
MYSRNGILGPLSGHVFRRSDGNPAGHSYEIRHVSHREGGNSTNKDKRYDSEKIDLMLLLRLSLLAPISGSPNPAGSIKFK